MIKKWLLKLGLWLARLGGLDYMYTVTFDYLQSARQIYPEIERQKFHNGEQKRHAALRAMMNRHPNAKERDLALAIEVIVQEMSQ